MRINKRNHYHQPDSPDSNRKSKKDSISKNQLTWNSCFRNVASSLFGAQVFESEDCSSIQIQNGLHTNPSLRRLSRALEAKPYFRYLYLGHRRMCTIDEFHYRLDIRAVAEVEESVAVGWIVWQARARSALSLTCKLEELRAVAEVEESVVVGWIVWQARARSALSLTYDIQDDNSI
ncbi:hypothetical protein J6590_084758 [Homalodisca vitripennis]|nr:hypothetical protein J6590_084758 [Homalodisca vitripennis]